VSTIADEPLRLGTRGSRLALAQAETARLRLKDLAPPTAGTETIEIVVIRTTGDRVLDRPLAEIGGKGLFTKEIDEALLAGRIDLAVHSVKDLPTWLPDGIVLACVLPRGDPRDALIATAGKRLEDLPPGTTVGTASLRRQAQLLHHRPDLKVVPLRGNVETRLNTVKRGTLGATLLAAAGLDRLGLGDRASARLAPEAMLPAVGQAAIGITCRRDDERLRSLLGLANDAATAAAVAAERAMLAVLDGSCRTPIAGLARTGAPQRLDLEGLVARPDGTKVIAAARSGAAGDAERIGEDLGVELKRRAGAGFFQIP
jgi:hydroxymethylbilane synthase